MNTKVQTKNVMFRTDARLFQRARLILVLLAKMNGAKLRKSDKQVGKSAPVT